MMDIKTRFQLSGRFWLRAVIFLALVAWVLPLNGPTAAAAPSGAGIPPGHADRIFRVKLVEGTSGDLQSLLPDDLSAAVQKTDPLFTLPKTKMKDLKAKGDEKLKKEKGGAFVPLPDLALWYDVRLTQDADPETALAAFQALPFVAFAGAAPLPGELPAAGDYTSYQSYTYGSASGGIEADYAWTFAGGTGEGITIYDIEYSWNQNHEDLTKARNVPLLLSPGDTAVDPWVTQKGIQSPSHGTSVLGELIADRDTKGVTGIAYGASIGLAPANTQNLNYNVANAILLAVAQGQAGDVILIEQQTDKVCGLTYGPSEWEQAVFDAIQTATANGFVVVEAAGNGDQVSTGIDLDQTACNGRFDPNTHDSGAIIVGAGKPPSTGADRQRIGYSSYGSRVNVQAWGSGIYSTGTGDLYGYTLTQKLDDDYWYTKSFKGTSGASPMVAAAAAIIQGIAVQEYGAPLSPGQVRNVLVQTGDAQQYPSGVTGEHIGPRPNLRRAIDNGLPQPDAVMNVIGEGGSGDGFCGIGNCTLAEAIAAANSDPAPTNIYLAAGTTYTLDAVNNTDATYGANGLPVITTPITINAKGAIIERSSAAGTPEFRLFQVASGGTLTLKQATLRNGSLSGGSGGAIVNLGTATISSSTITGGSAADGGAIANQGTLTVANSTITANSATTSGGGVKDGGTLKILSSTLAGNSAPTSGNLSTSGSPTVKNTILVKGASGANCSGTLSSSSTNNLADDDTCGGSATVRTATGIGLATLADNGGPTHTMALGSASAAIDMGNANACKDSNVNNRDQRGYDRLIDGNADDVFTCDIGAYEYGSSAPLPPAPSADTTPPVMAIFLTPDTADGSNGWYRSPVTPAVLFMDYESRVVQVRCALDPATPPPGFDDLPDEVCPFIGAGMPVAVDGPHTLYAAAADEYDNKGALDEYGNVFPFVSAGFQIDTTPPVITCPSAGPFLLHSGDHVVGPAGVDASVSGLDEAASTLSGIVTTEAVGPQVLTFTAFDLAGNSASQECTYNVIYDFGGPYPPLAAGLNTAKAGQAAPVKLSLAGDQGMGVLTGAFSQPVACDTLAPAGDMMPAQWAGHSGLSYDPETGWYNIVWKTRKDWAGTCRALVIQLVDGTEHQAYFQFE